MNKHTRKHTNPIVSWVLLAFWLLSFDASAQEHWTVEQCMKYAVEHNHTVRVARLTADNYEASRLAAIGSFLPYASASTGVQYNFGRAIDPETNTYTNVSTFYNYYALSTSIPVFDGFERVHQLKAARADLLAGKSNLQAQKDQTALATFEQFIHVLYYQKTVQMAEQHLQECDLMLRQTRVMEEVGRKSVADVAQMEAQQAEADYELTRQQNLLTSAMLALKQQMNYPVADELLLAEMPTDQDQNQQGEVNFQFLPLQQLYHQKESARLHLRQAKAAFWPSITLNVGASTSFYKTLHTPAAASFPHQFRNNIGKYVAATLTIPLFNRLQTITSVRRAKNNYLIAQEQYEAKRAEIEKLVVEAANDIQGYQKATLQCQKKVAADSLALLLTRRQWDEGLCTAIDLKTAATTLLQSRASLLQNSLAVRLRRLYLAYYQGNFSLK